MSLTWADKPIPDTTLLQALVVCVFTKQESNEAYRCFAEIRSTFNGYDYVSTIEIDRNTYHNIIFSENRPVKLNLVVSIDHSLPRLACGCIENDHIGECSDGA